MNSVWFRPALIALLLVVEIAAGVWVRNTGRPYGTLPLTIHKLIALGLVVYLVVRTLNINKAAALGAIGWIIPAAAALTLLGAMATGGWMAATESHPLALFTIHRLLAYLAVPLAVAAFYTLRGG